jgi:hypothetical protein
LAPGDDPLHQRRQSSECFGFLLIAAVPIVDAFDPGNGVASTLSAICGWTPARDIIDLDALRLSADLGQLKEVQAGYLGATV